MDKEDRETVRTNLLCIYSAYKRTDRRLKAMISDISKVKYISKRKTIEKLEDMRKILADTPSFEIPIEGIVEKERLKN